MAITPRTARTGTGCPAVPGSPRGDTARENAGLVGQFAAPHASRRTARRASLAHVGGQACRRSTAKPWFMRGDLDAAIGAVRQRLTGWLAPRWPWCILVRLRADREAEQLVAEADAEHRLARPPSSCLDHRHRIDAGRGRVAGAVGEEHAVGRWRHDLVERVAVAGTTVTRAPAAHEVAQDVALGAVVDRDDVGADARGAVSLWACPSTGSGRTDFARRVPLPRSC